MISITRRMMTAEHHPESEECWKHQLSIAIPSRLDHIRLVRAAFAGVLTHIGVVEQDVNLLGIAVAEVFNNSIQHGYREQPDRDVQMTLWASSSRVRIQISDHASSFPESEAYRLSGTPLPMEQLNDQWTTRGHGLQIVRQIVDSITLRSEKSGNSITFEKRVSIES